MESFLNCLSAPKFLSPLSQFCLILPRVFVFVNEQTSPFSRLGGVDVLSGLEIVRFGVDGSFDGLTQDPGLCTVLKDRWRRSVEWPLGRRVWS